MLTNSNGQFQCFIAILGRWTKEWIELRLLSFTEGLIDALHVQMRQISGSRLLMLQRRRLLIHEDGAIGRHITL